MTARVLRSSCWAFQFAVLALSLCGVTRPVLAQTTSPTTRPYRGLFEGGNPAPGQKLGINWSLFGVRDDNLTADTRAFDPAQQVGGSYGDAAVTMGYIDRGDHLSIIANGTGTGRYYRSLDNLTELGGSGDVTVNLDLGRRKSTKISLFQTTSYQPYFQLNFLNIAPSQPVVAGTTAPSQSNPLTRVDSREYDGTFRFSEAWTERSTLSFDYTYRYTKLGGSPEPFTWQMGNATFIHRYTKYASLRLGYGYGLARDGVTGSPPVKNQNVDVGIDYARPLSFSRRTTITFGSGTSIVTDQFRSYYRVLADAGLTREIGRTWSLNGTYHRGVQYVEGLGGPVYADTVQMGMHGLVARRLDLGMTGGYSNGAIALSTVDNAYITYTGAVTLRVALSRLLALETQYAYYYYDFNSQAPVLPGIPGRLRRNSLRVGFSGWFGLLR